MRNVFKRKQQLLTTNRLPWVSVWTNYWTHNCRVFAYEGRRRSGKPLIPSSLPPASLQDLPSLTAQTGCREEPLFGAQLSWEIQHSLNTVQESIKFTWNSQNKKLICCVCFRFHLKWKKNAQNFATLMLLPGCPVYYFSINGLINGVFRL